jgi:signal transduction histidine kinase
LELGDEVEVHLYRIVSEALHNVIKHAGAQNAIVTVTTQADLLRVTVADDGAGFDPDTGHAGHLGLSTMAERAEAIGADLSVTSASGRGTTIMVSLPQARRGQGISGGPGA